MKKPADLSARIAADIRASIVAGRLLVGDRLPSEAELAEQFGVSRSTVREALKRLAAQNLIRTQRGAAGGAFVNHLSYADAHAQQVTTATLLLSMNAISFDVACEARFALERACAPLAAARRTEAQLVCLRTELGRQSQPGLTDEEFCASDVAFHRALVDGAGNPVLSYQLAGAVEGMLPLMNMITFTARNRVQIVNLHNRIAEGLTAGDAASVEDALHGLEAYTRELARDVFAARDTRA